MGRAMRALSNDCRIPLTAPWAVAARCRQEAPASASHPGRFSRRSVLELELELERRHLEAPRLRRFRQIAVRGRVPGLWKPLPTPATDPPRLQHRWLGPLH